MSFSQVNGYVPTSVETLMDAVRLKINEVWLTDYTEETFVGSGWYKYFYTLVQKASENEIKTSEIFLKLSEYITLTNQKIQRPSVSNPGVVDSFESRGYRVAVKPPNNTDAGKIFIAVDIVLSDPLYASKKLEIATLIKDFVAAGIVSQGAQVTNIVLTNGQSFPFKFDIANRIPIKLRLTVSISENNLMVVPGDIAIRTTIFNNINARYRLGYNFEPQRYFTLSDAPWAGSLVLEWSTDSGATWHDEVYDADYKDLFTFGLADISVVFA